MIAVAVGLIASALIVTWRMWHRMKLFIHMAQLHGYKPHEFAPFLKTKIVSQIVRPSHVASLVLGIGVFLFGDSESITWAGVCMAWVGFVIFASAVDYIKDDTKKPLKFTARARRLAGIALTLSVLVLMAIVLPLNISSDVAIARSFAALALFDFVAPLSVLAATILALPVERTIQNGFKKQARRKLASMPNLKIVAITGSYGKTSVKFAVAEILKQRYNVLATPGSFNTPMGICLVINRDLQPEHQVLVLEMGARYPGDIQELCDIARPDISIVTNVGIAHMETLGDQDGIAREKGTIVENVSPDGLAILNGDDDRVRSMSTRTSARVVYAGLDAADSAVRASDVRYDANGATFEISDGAGDNVQVRTKLVGKHNIQNILISAVVGLEMNLRLRQIAHAIGRLQPVEHRLEIKKAGKMTIIDDAFNSNPVGARNAVEILGQFSSGRRIIVTPGMIELGDRQYEENKSLGEAIAANVDVAILIGKKQTAPIQDGLLQAGYPEDQIRVFDSLFDAQHFLSSFAVEGDVVLYENDLPDQFDEAA